MAAPTQQQYAIIWNKYMEALEEITELKTQLIEKDEYVTRKDETITRLRRELNNSKNKVARLAQMMDPMMFLASQ